MNVVAGRHHQVFNNEFSEGISKFKKSSKLAAV